MHLLIRAIAITAYPIFFSSMVLAQSGPLRFLSPFQGLHTDTIALRTASYIPDSTRVSLAEIRFCSKTENTESRLSIGVSNTGGLLAFADSMLTRPLLIEKRSAFPFIPFLPDQPYFLIYTPSPGPGDYLAFRLMNAGKKEVLDEIYLCSYLLPRRISHLSCNAWISEK